MRTQGCREAMEKVKDLCNISSQTLKLTDLVAKLCKERGNAPLQRCATDALEPITKIKNIKTRRAVIDESNKILRQRNDNGEFVKEKLTRPEIKEIIAKYQPQSKKSIIPIEKPPTYKLNKQQFTLLKRLVSLKYTSDEKAAFDLLFKWAAERIAKKK